MIVVALASGGVCLSAQGRGPKTPAASGSGGTEDAFAVLSTEAQNGSLFPHGVPGGQTLDGARAEVERELGHYRLVAQSRWQAPMGWGGLWGARDAAGYVSVSIWTPDEYDQTKDRAVVAFQPARQDSLAPEELSELLSAAQTTQSEGDLLEVSLPQQKAASKAGCSSQTTLTLRVTNGALVEESVTAYCDVSASDAGSGGGDSPEPGQ